MTDLDHVVFRAATPDDAHDVAALHADSWRRHYRGAYSDAYLDGDVLADRLAVWTLRLAARDPGRDTIVARDGGRLVGFSHVVFRNDPVWGSLLDNVHVSHESKRQGIGARLLALTAAAVIANSPDQGLWLWVLEQNVDAQAFYRALGGEQVERAMVEPPGGDASRLCGAPAKLRLAWRDPSALRG